MSVTGKAALGLAGLALAGGAGLIAAVPAGAATQACGTGCMTLYDQELGTGEVTAVFAGAPHVRLSAAADSAAEDWQLTTKGNVADLSAQGLVTSQIAALFGQDTAYEFQFTPDGVVSGLCLGLASAARQGERVTLRPCGVNSETIWVADQADQSGRTLPLIPGSDTSASLVLTGGGAGKGLTVTQVSVTSGTIAPDQLWGTRYGLLP